MKNRRFERVNLASQTLVTTNNYCFSAMTKDISLSGLLICTDHHIPAGERVSLSLNLPSVSRSSLVTVDGIVVRNTVHGVAFHFKSLDHDTFCYLKTILSRKPPCLRKGHFSDVPVYRPPRPLTYLPV